MTIETRFDIGQLVYLVTDEDQDAHMVTKISLGGRQLMYELTLGTTSSMHYEFEISDQPDKLKKLL